MKFCIITPIQGLERYATLSDTHLVLAHVTDDRYRSFYRMRKDLGDTLILDNSAYEGVYNPATVEVALNYYRPQVAVLPDTMNDPRKTGGASLRFLDQWAEHYPKTEWLYMLHTDEETDLYLHADKVLYDTRVGHYITWVGIPRCLTTDNQLDRVEVAEQFGEYKRHAFGMVDGDIDELRRVRESGLFESCDSSAPVWRGYYGWSLTNPNHREAWHKHGTSVDFNYTGEFENCHEQILTNLEACGVNIQRNSASPSR